MKLEIRILFGNLIQETRNRLKAMFSLSLTLSYPAFFSIFFSSLFILFFQFLKSNITTVITITLMASSSALVLLLDFGSRETYISTPYVCVFYLQ